MSKEKEILKQEKYATLRRNVGEEMQYLRYMLPDLGKKRLNRLATAICKVRRGDLLPVD